MKYLPLSTKQPDIKVLSDVTAKYTLNALNNDEGDILVFLPGVKEIHKVYENLRGKVPPNTELLMLYSTLDKDMQDRALNPLEKRKIILSTNIAQTSLTIEGVRVVIDSGLEKLSFFDHANDMDSLKLSFISKESAVQRAGRAGRTSRGKCYRLWHEKKILTPSTKPEILRSDISQLILETMMWGVKDIKELKFLDYPSPDTIYEVKKTLKNIQMLDKDFNISSFGKESIKLGVHPRYSFLLLQSIKSHYPYEACLLVSLLEEVSVLRKYTDIYYIFEEISKYKSIVKKADIYF